MTAGAEISYKGDHIVAAPVMGSTPELAAKFNLRDLGGFLAHGGRRTRYGLILRGGMLHGIDEEEKSFFNGLGLRYVYDLRSTREVGMRPDDIVPAGATYLQGSGMIEDGREVDFSPEFMVRLENQRRDEVSNGLWAKFYREMAFGNPHVHEIMQLVAEKQTPIYIHCTAGKDRTGVVVVIIGLMLGVSREDLLWDFMLTNDYRVDHVEEFIRSLPPDTTEERKAQYRKNMSVQDYNLKAVFAAIDERYPSVEAYLEDEFGLDESKLAELRDFYLE